MGDGTGRAAAAWGLAQYPSLVVPDLTFANTAAPDSVLQPLLTLLVIGVIILVLSFGYLYMVFKRQAQLFNR
jgi:cytochrome bd ubiquinol oxidase subunit II